MCTCIKDWEKKMINIEVKGKKPISAAIISAAFIEPSWELQTVTEMELTFEGQKKKVIQNLVHKFCPFCGQPYPSINNQQQ
jgi:hypothetical protein